MCTRVSSRNFYNDSKLCNISYPLLHDSTQVVIWLHLHYQIVFKNDLEEELHKNPFEQNNSKNNVRARSLGKGRKGV